MGLQLPSISIIKKSRRRAQMLRWRAKLFLGKKEKEQFRSTEKVHRNTLFLTLLIRRGMNRLAIEIWQKNTHHDPCHCMTQSEKISRCL